MTENVTVMTETEGPPHPTIHKVGHQNTIYLSATANGTTDGSLTLMAQQMATQKACLTDLNDNAEGCLNDLGGSTKGSPD
jgi:hypothetical protein